MGKRIGWIGLGRMGEAMVKRLLKTHQGHPLLSVQAVVMQASLANIDSVMVAGRWKKRFGTLLEVDLAPKLAALRASGAKITDALKLSKQ